MTFPEKVPFIIFGYQNFLLSQKHSRFHCRKIIFQFMYFQISKCFLTKLTNYVFYKSRISTDYLQVDNLKRVNKKVQF